MALKKQAKLHIEVTVQELELKIRKKLNLMAEVQMALRKDVEKTNDCISDMLIVLNNKIDFL